MGEFELINSIVKASRRASSGAFALSGASVIVPNGDDAAVLDVRAAFGSDCLAISTDMLVEGVHFDCGLMSFYDVGVKSVTANISDMAATGGARPLFCVVGLAIPVDTNVENVDNLLAGMRSAVAKDGITLIGGDTVRSNKSIVISVTIVGRIDKKSVVERGGAKAGDLICVTGAFGDAAAGLRVLQGQRKSKRLCRARYSDAIRTHGYGQLVHAYRRPRHRLNEAVLLTARMPRPTAMMDSSDGLAACVRAMASAADLGAVVNLRDVPLSRAFRRWALSASSGPLDPKFPWRTVAEGGEEYELVFTAGPSDVPALKKRVNFSVVGEMRRGKGVDFMLNGKKMAGEWRGYENF